MHTYNIIKLASGVIDPNKFNPGSVENAFNQAKEVTDVGATIVQVIQVCGIIVTVIVLLILGIKYMTGTVSEKAEYKKTMIPYLIGVIIFFSITQLLAIIMDFGTSINS